MELELYFHIPFCVRKCAYCDFLSAPAGRERMRQYVDALKKEILTIEGVASPTVTTVFFGGGTPSLLPEEWIGEILEAAHLRFPFAADTEITLEANPGTVSPGRLEAYRKLGINRLSLGLQSAVNEELRLLGRIHTWEQFLETFRAAREAGFENINVDLMSGLPGQTAESWEYTLRSVTVLAPEHISAYSLIIEEGTPFYERYHEDALRLERGEEPRYLPDEELERAMYRLTEQVLDKAGLRRYEISNYAREGRECRHNVGYWTRVPYAGFGIGAASLLGNTRLKNTEDLDAYLDRFLHGKSQCGIPEQERLSVEDEMSEFMFLGLRLTRGVDKKEFRHLFGTGMEERYGEQLTRLEGQGLIRDHENRVSLTEKGLDVANYVMAEFL